MVVVVVVLVVVVLIELLTWTEKNDSISGNEAPGFSNTSSAWPITVPLMGQPQQEVQISSTTPDPQMAMSESFAPQYSPLAFSYPPFVEQPGEAPSTSGIQDIKNQMHEYGVWF